MKHEHCISTCNSLLRGERSAVETYDQSIEKHQGNPTLAIALTEIRNEHSEAVSILEQNVRSMGGDPDTTSGAWGVLTGTLQGAANLIGSTPALEGLQQGEQFGINGYEAALKDENVMPDCKELIETKLLPPTREHLVILEALQKTL